MPSTSQHDNLQAEPAGHVQANERPVSLGGHHRLHPLRNHSAPIDVLPVEVLSGIFQQVRELHAGPKFGPALFRCRFDTYSACLPQAFVLSAVSTHFRHVAFCTPDLWKRITLNLVGGKIDRASSLLHHCITLAPYVKISVRERRLDEEAVFSAVEALLTPEVTHKVKVLDLRCLVHVSLWLKKLQASSFPILDCLLVSTGAYRSVTGSLGFDLGTLKSVTRLYIDAPNLELPVIVPPFIRTLGLSEVPQKVQISILYQCPNLVNCFSWHDDRRPDSTQFVNPLTLPHLQCLRWRTHCGLETISSVQNLRLPSLQILNLLYYVDRKMSPNDEEFDSIHLLCSNVSATLTTLSIYASSPEYQYQNLRRLFRIQLPNLQRLGVDCECRMNSPHNILQALTPRDDECSDSEPSNLPSLKYLTVGSDRRVEPPFLLDLLAKWNLVGKTSHFRFEMKYIGRVQYVTGHKDWSPELREELSLIVGNRQVEVIWGQKHSKRWRGEDIDNI